jgi:RHS repeat-associated protein
MNKFNKYLLIPFLLIACIAVNGQNLNTPNKMGPMGTQVNTSTGNLFISRTDIFIPGRGLDLNLSFSYNSYEFGSNSGFGNGWSFSYQIKYRNDSSNVKTIIWGDAREDGYTFNGSAYLPPVGFFDSLVEYQPNKYLLKEVDGTKLYFDNAIHKKITKLEDPNGNTVNFTYTDSILTSITNSAGQSISLTYNSKGVLSNIADAISTPVRNYIYNYDAYGNLTKMTDPMNGSMQYTYLVNGPMKTMTDKNSNTIDIIYYNNYATSEIIGCNKRQSFSYDTVTNVTIVTDYLGDGDNQITKYVYKKINGFKWLTEINSNCCGSQVAIEYDNKGNKIKETDANGNVTNYTYDNNGFIVDAKYPLDKTYSFAYSSLFKTVESIKDPKGAQTKLYYDSKGNMNKIEYPTNEIYTSTHNALGDLITTTNPKGNTFNYTFNSNGKPTLITGPNNFKVQLSYDAHSNLTSITDAQNSTISAEHDLLNRVKRITDPYNNKIDYEYDLNGNVISIKNKNNEITYYKYDASNRLVEVKDAMGNKSNLTYDAMNNLRSIQNPITSSEFSYNAKNLLIGTRDNLGNKIVMDYDANENVTSTTMPNGNTYNYTYDQLNRIKSVNDEYGSLVKLNYDKNDNITSITNQAGVIYTAQYDSLNQIKKVYNPSGKVASFQYDKSNKLISQTDYNGFTVFYSYDSLNRIKMVTDQNGAKTITSYNTQGNVISLQDAKGNITNYTHDSLSRIKKIIYPDFTFKEYTYDKKGNVLTERLTDGTSINFTYDTLNRVIAKTLPDGNNYQYTYDAVGKMKTATNSVGTIFLAYDNLNRIVSETLNSRKVTYDYNTSGRMQTTIYPDSTIVTKIFDKRNRVISISKNGTVVVNYQYNNADQVIAKTLGNGITTTMQYDINGRLTNLTSGNGSIQNNLYTYDNKGNKIKVEKLNTPSKSEQFSYDNGDRLINFKKGIINGVPTINNTYTYDSLGNRTNLVSNGVSTSYTSNNLNQISNSNNAIQNINFTYDARGNMTYDGKFYKFYNKENKIIKDSTSPALVIEYGYDAIGRLNNKKLNADVTKYSYSGLLQIEELNAGNIIKGKTIFGDYLDPINFEKNGKNYFYHNNDLNSVEAISSASGNVIETYEYDVYGEQQVYDSLGNSVAGSNLGNKYGFTGQIFDSATNSIKFQFRDYNPEIGIFNERDLIGYSDGMGVYQYVHNNPGNGIDILGLNDCDCDNKKLSEALNGSHPYLDFGSSITGLEGQLSDAASNAAFGAESLLKISFKSDMQLARDALKSFGSGSVQFRNYLKSARESANKLKSMGNSQLLKGLTTLGTINAIYDAAAMTQNCGANIYDRSDAYFGLLLNGIGYAPGPAKFIAGGYGLINSGSKAVFGVSAPQLFEPVAEFAGNASGEISDAMSEGYDLLHAGLFGSEEERNFVIKRDAIRRQMEERQERNRMLAAKRNKMNPPPAEPPKPDCPENGPTGGTQKPPPGIPPPCPTCTGTGTGIAAFDPNEIIGPTGQPSKAWVSVNDRLPYTITYENAKAAGAPAKYVKVITPIEPKQDPATFQLGNFAFNNLTFNVPTNAPSYYNRLDCRDSLGLYVDVTAGYDVLKNEAFWEFQSIDPVTLLPPTNPLVGFLLLQDSAKATSGHGFVNFSIKPKTNAITLDTIVAKAKIVFDSNDTIPTNFHKNTIDAFTPTSHMNTLPATSPNPVALSWTGTDDVAGCGVKSYTLYVSTNGVSFYILKSGITRTDTTIRLAQDSSYCFFVLATDSVGNMEALRPGEIKCTTISGGVLPVTWLYFRGANKDKDNVLEWATTNEQNSKNFILERSLNAVNFISIATIAAQGNSTSQQNYDYKDVGIDKLNSAVFYYRLKQFDLNGSFKTSNIVRLNYNQKGIINSIVYPNPTQGMITVTVGDRALVGTQALVYDVNGRLLQQVKIAAQSQSFNFNSLVNGIYFIRLENKEVMKIIKQ